MFKGSRTGMEEALTQISSKLLGYQHSFSCRIFIQQKDQEQASTYSYAFNMPMALEVQNMKAKNTDVKRHLKL